MEAIHYNNYTIKVEYDQFTDDPTGDGNYSIHETRGVHSPELAAKLKDGYAFTIDRLEHGNVIYRLSAGVPDWDTSRDWGYIEFTDEYATNFDTYEGRKEMAAEDLKEYTAWANGECYTLHVTDPYGDNVEDISEFGIIGDYQWAIDEAKRLIDQHRPNYAAKAKRASEVHQ